MATLENTPGGSIVPSFDRAIDIFRSGQAADEAEAQRQEQQQKTQEQIDILLGGGQPTTPSGQPAPDPDAPSEEIKRITQINPQFGQAVSGALQRGDPQELATIRTEAEKGGALATELNALPDFASKQRKLADEGAKMIAAGGDVNRIIELQNKSPAELDLELQRMELVSNDVQRSIPKQTGIFSTPTKQKAFANIAATNPQLAKTLLAADKQRQAAGATGTGDFSKGTGVIVRLADGTQARSVPILNKETGQLENRIIPLGGAPISRLGETGPEQTARVIQQAGGVAGARLGEELEQAAPIAAATTKGRAEQTRTQGIINRGLDAADTVPILNRSIALLDSVETGGFDRAALAAKQFFGIESANEAELSSNLGKTVLSQLRSTFGAAFTEREGARLATIEAGFGKSVAGNRRLLLQTKRIAERAASRAIKTAEKAGDQATADEIREAMAFSLDTAEQPAAAQQVIEFDAQGNIIQ